MEDLKDKFVLLMEVDAEMGFYNIIRSGFNDSKDDFMLSPEEKVRLKERLRQIDVHLQHLSATKKDCLMHISMMAKSESEKVKSQIHSN